MFCGKCNMCGELGNPSQVAGLNLYIGTNVDFGFSYEIEILVALKSLIP